MRRPLDRFRFALVLLLAVGTAGLVAACDDDTNNRSSVTTTAPSEPTGGETDESPGDSATSSGSAAVPRVDESQLEVTEVATGLVAPWEMRFLPDGDLLVTERPGRLVRISLPDGGQTPVGNVAVTATGESGLLGFDLHPDYPGEPYLYVAYTHSEGGDLSNRLSRFEFDGRTLGAETVLLDDIPAARIHDGSRVAFGPDGMLWMTTGDAGRADLAQDPDSLAGKVLRLTPEGGPAPGNPDNGSPVYTSGHRNPQGLAWHPETGTPFVTEHGPDRGDEVNRLEAGGNYGWPEVAGPGGAPEFIDPVASWTPTIAPAGAAFYSGDALPGWDGALFFVTLKESDLRLLVPGEGADLEGAAESVLFDGGFGRMRAVAVGPDGAVYLATSNRDGRGRPGPDDDRILRVVAAD